MSSPAQLNWALSRLECSEKSRRSRRACDRTHRLLPRRVVTVIGQPHSKHALVADEDDLVSACGYALPDGVPLWRRSRWRHDGMLIGVWHARCSWCDGLRWWASVTVGHWRSSRYARSGWTHHLLLWMWRGTVVVWVAATVALVVAGRRTWHVGCSSKTWRTGWSIR